MTEDLTGMVDRLTVTDGATGLFIMRSRNPVKPEHAGQYRATWEAAWERAGRKAPVLLILDSTLTIEAVADADLQELGLMRIPVAT